MKDYNTAEGYRNVEVVENRWKNHVYLQPFQGDTLDRNNAAILLENTLKPIGSSDPAIIAFERLRGDITSQTFSRMAVRKLISIQAQLDHVLNPTYLFLDTASRVLEKDSQYVTHRHNVEWNHKQIDKIQSIHKYNAEIDMTRVYADEVAMSLDRGVLNTIMKACGTRAAWNFTTSLGDTIREKYESLYVKVVELSHVLHRKIGRGGANWIVTSPEVASIFETATAGFCPSLYSEETSSKYGVEYVGTINARWKLFKDPLFEPAKMLLGYQGGAMVDSGLYFMPQTLATIQPKDKNGDSYPFASKYAMEFKPDGEQYYACLTVEDFII